MSYNFKARTMFFYCVPNLLLYKCYGFHFAILECYGKYAQTFENYVDSNFFLQKNKLKIAICIP